MSDRPGNRPPAPDDDDNLDYLDAGLSGTAASADTEVMSLSTPSSGTTVVVAPPAASDRSWLWPVINAVGLLVVVLVNLAANAVEFNSQSTADVINKDPVPFQPAGWVFTIWGVIYAMLLAFVIYGLLPAGRRNVRLQRISPFFLIANIANVTWLFLWHYERFFAALITLLVLLGSLLAIYIGLRIKNPIRRTAPVEKPGWLKRLVLWAPFSVYLGWACVASLANLMVWLDRSDWGGGPFSYNTWAVIFMLAGALISAAFVFIAKDALIPVVFALAYIGICQHAWSDSMFVAISAIVFAVVCIGLAGMASVLAFDQDVDRGPFSRSSQKGDLPPMTQVDETPIERA